MAYEQTQKISGSASTSFGKKVSISGYYALVSDDSVSGYFFRRTTGGTWSEDDTFTMGGATTSFGNSIDIGKKYFVVGDPGYSGGEGGVGVFAISDPSISIQTLSPSSLVAGDSFGYAVETSDDYILVGALNADSNMGDVYLYIKGTGETWTEYSGNPITPYFRNTNDFFGCSVAIIEDSLIIGALGDNNKTGAIYVFDKNIETDLWEESQKLFASDGTYNDQFGESLSASGEYFIAGASLSESVVGEVNSGAAYVYRYGTSWYEVDKLTGVYENSYSGNNFGESVDINGDYIIVGSPDARATGVADIFYKKRSWGHLKKVVGRDSSSEDDFGHSVAISGRFALVGSPSEGSNGAIYFSEDPPVRLRLAQEFEVNGEYLPSKASIYLKRVGENSQNYWPIYNTSKTVIDATNFSTIDYGRNITIFDDSLSDFTGNGYMILSGDSFSDFTSVNYPIRAITSDTFNLWIRCLSTESSTFQADILIDGVKSKTINEIVPNPSEAMWGWIRTTLILPDAREHILGIRIKESGAAIDKIYIDASLDTPYSEGPGYGASPYLTVHMRVYDSDGEKPDTSLFIYDYKNSIDHAVQSDWYNFNMNTLDDTHGYAIASDFTGNYFLVVSCSGTSTDNFVVWEMMDNDEYMTLPSTFRF